MNEQIVLVDDAGSIIGNAPKLESHHGSTPLHLAFSCYLFNEAGEFLLTRRALSKKVWPGVWTNSVCGHPAPGETNEEAIIRRAAYELGLQGLEDLQLVLPDYRYKTPPYKGIIENEICPVFFGRVTDEPIPNPEEVDDHKWVRWPALKGMIAADPDVYSFWFKDQLKQLAGKDISDFLKPSDN